MERSANWCADLDIATKPTGYDRITNPSPSGKRNCTTAKESARTTDEQDTHSETDRHARQSSAGKRADDIACFLTPPPLSPSNMTCYRSPCTTRRTNHASMQSRRPTRVRPCKYAGGISRRRRLNQSLGIRANRAGSRRCMLVPVWPVGAPRRLGRRLCRCIRFCNLADKYGHDAMRCDAMLSVL
ncbi:hypothetical protein M3J09_007865 [Ascochyta lentis]